ncbi:helix-turn-helix domain-containing protein [Amycolatopsis sp. NPDC051372]|uniref:ArsR/SmtB family transcription factor n=1 Tax=unclassified Amycolatopsis TaxID=2618356 RepID=UPI00342F52AB
MTGDDYVPPSDSVEVRTTEQLRAVNNLVRHRVLAVLRDGPATITQIAARLDLAKGSSSYHVRVLERAGLIHVVRTRKVRGVVERYYGMVAKTVVVPDPAPGQRDVLLQHAIDDLATAPEGARYVRMSHLRLGESRYAEFERRLGELLDEMHAAREPSEPAATIAVAFFRPGEGAAQ